MKTAIAAKNSATRHSKLEHREWSLLVYPKHYELAQYIALVLNEGASPNVAGVISPILRAQSCDGSGVVLVATNGNGQVVGGVITRLDEVCDLVVAPEFRRRGVGRFLVESLKRSRSKLTAAVDHFETTAFWSKMKFTPVVVGTKASTWRWELDW